jgi:hypothetical protein
MTHSSHQIPVDTLLMGLRERRKELTAQLDRLEHARQTAESDLEALDAALSVIGRGSRQSAAPAVPQAVPAPSKSMAKRKVRPGISALVGTVLKDYGPLSPGEVVAEVREREPDVEPATVYRTLHRGTRAGWILAEEKPGRGRAYSLAPGASPRGEG